jgi:branched-subunit amino acid ABC-type transport system permease component
MYVVNFAHGSLFMIGAYLAATVLVETQSFVLAVLAATTVVTVLSIVIEYFSIRPLYDSDPIYTLLLTFGVAFILDNLVVFFWGTDPFNVPTPGYLEGVIEFGGVTFPIYRLFIISIGAVVAIGIYIFLTYTRYGLLTRAGTINREMVSANGVNIQRIFTVMFAMGGMLAGLAGTIVVPMFSAHPEIGHQYLIIAFVVVVIGGMGSYRGSVIGALLVGFTQGYANFYVPEVAGLVLYILMVVVLLLKPQGIIKGIETEGTH